MATAKPSRTRKQPSAKPLTPAQKQRQRDQIARERTEQLVHQAYERQLRQTKIAIASTMGCKRCAENRKRSLEKRRELMAQRRSKLETACAQGDQRACRELHNLDTADHY